MNVRKGLAALVMAGSIMAGSVVCALVMDPSVAEATSRTEVNRYIRANGGIPPCAREDGSGQPGACFWDASERGNGEGYDFVAVPGKPGDDKRYVYLTGPKAVRY